MTRKVFDHTNRMALSTKNSAGFTIIEILVVMGLLAMVAGLTMVININDYRGYLFRGDRDVVVNVLERARSQAINNVCLGATCTGGMPHGVHVQASQVVLFQGATYSAGAATNQVFPFNGGAQAAGLSDVVFTQLSGDAAPTGTISLSDTLGHSSVITVNSEGQITWTN